MEDRRLITSMSENTIEELYKKVDQLIGYCEALQSDNRQLQLREQELLSERERLIEKNEQARTRVEAMIGHLKNLQRSTV